MKRLFLLFSACFLWVNLAHADQVLTPEVSIKSVQAIKTSESRDELYLDVTEFPSEGLPSHFQVPKFPMFWPSTHLNQVVDFKVWARTLKEGASVTLILSLIDRDAPPWNTDDLLGEAKLQLKNDHGKLIAKWSMPNRNDKAPIEKVTKGSDGQFDFKRDDSHYKIHFHVK